MRPPPLISQETIRTYMSRGMATAEGVTDAMTPGRTTSETFKLLLQYKRFYYFYSLLRQTQAAHKCNEDNQLKYKTSIRIQNRKTPS